MSYCSGWAPTLVPNFWDLLHTPTWCDKQQTKFYVIGWLRLVFPLPLLLFGFIYDRLLPDSFWYPLSRLLKMAIMSVIADSQYYKFYNALYFVKSSMLLLHDNCIVIVCLMHTHRWPMFFQLQYQQLHWQLFHVFQLLSCITHCHSPVLYLFPIRHQKTLTPAFVTISKRGILIRGLNSRS